MNFPSLDNISGRQRCRTWTPLLTQQLRLRHLYQVIAYNVSHQVSDGFYYTLHTTAMCAPFYTSEKIVSQNPKWFEIEIDNSRTNSASSALVLRVWQQSQIILTWGINFSGLIYLGNKLSDVQPESFIKDTVILYLRGGYFTSEKHVKTDAPLSTSLNVIRDDREDLKPYRISRLEFPTCEVRNMYDIEKLRRLHSLQIAIKNKCLDVGYLRDKINSRDGLITCNNEVSTSKRKEDVPENTNVRYAPQLLTMTSLNKMLQEKPTKVQKQEIVRLKKEIENCKLKSKILVQERDRKHGALKLLKNQYKIIIETNEEKSSNLMEDYRCLCKDVERLREWKKEHQHQKECLNQLTRKLHNRRRQLMSELLILYPIEKQNEKRFLINGIYLPSSDMLTDCSDGGLSVALGYVAHVLLMCASFLQVPLRYPLQHVGSRSVIEDNVSATLWEKNREFPLYTRGKDRMQFNYAVYLLNKNIAQYLYLLGARTPDLRDTLPNVLALLQGKEHRQDQEHKSDELSKDNASLFSEDLLRSDREYYGNDVHKVLFGPVQNIPDPILDCLKYECQAEKMRSPKHARKTSKEKFKEQGQSLSQILAIPEAYMSQQMSSSVFKNYMNASIDTLESSTSSNTDCTPCGSKEPINCDNYLDSNKAIEITTEKSLTINSQLSRSVGSCMDEPKPLQLYNTLELGSDPLINTSGNSLEKNLERHCASEESLEVSQKVFLQGWSESESTSFYSEEMITPICDDSPLTSRTDALLKTKSFNLVKPKF